MHERSCAAAFSPHASLLKTWIAREKRKKKVDITPWRLSCHQKRTQKERGNGCFSPWPRPRNLCLYSAGGRRNSPLKLSPRYLAAIDIPRRDLGDIGSLVIHVPQVCTAQDKLLSPGSPACGRTRRLRIRREPTVVVHASSCREMTSQLLSYSFVLAPPYTCHGGRGGREARDQERETARERDRQPARKGC